MEIAPLPMTAVQPVGSQAIQPVASIQGFTAGAAQAVQSEGVSFQQFLGNAIGQTNQALLESDDMSRKLATGQVQDIHQVMVALEKANLSLQYTLQMRNKVIDAYQEIMRMSI